MAYSPANLEGKLASLNETQESITAVAQWIMFHKRHAQSTADVWAAYAEGAPANRRLALVYLANEVAQQSRARRKQEYVDAWSKVIPKAVQSAFKAVDKPAQERILRVNRVWRDRNVFAENIQQDIDSRLTGAGPSSSGASNVPASLRNLVELWTKYEAGRDNIRGAEQELADFEASQQDDDRLLLLKRLRDSNLDKHAALATTLEAIASELDTLSSEIAQYGLPGLTSRLVAQKTSIEQEYKDSLPNDPLPEVIPLSPVHAPKQYTAHDASKRYEQDNAKSDDDEIGYAPDSDTESKQSQPPSQSQQQPPPEPTSEPPKQLNLDPQLAMFLASMSGAQQN